VQIRTLKPGYLFKQINMHKHCSHGTWLKQKPWWPARFAVSLKKAEFIAAMAIMN